MGFSSGMHFTSDCTVDASICLYREISTFHACSYCSPLIRSVNRDSFFFLSKYQDRFPLEWKFIKWYVVCRTYILFLFWCDIAVRESISNSFWRWRYPVPSSATVHGCRWNIEWIYGSNSSLPHYVTSEVMMRPNIPHSISKIKDPCFLFSRASPFSMCNLQGAKQYD